MDTTEFEKIKTFVKVNKLLDNIPKFMNFVNDPDGNMAPAPWSGAAAVEEYDLAQVNEVLQKCFGNDIARTIENEISESGELRTKLFSCMPTLLRAVGAPVQGVSPLSIPKVRQSSEIKKKKKPSQEAKFKGTVVKACKKFRVNHREV